MAKPRSKAKLLSEIHIIHQRLEVKIASISQDDMLRPKTVGAWSVKDTIAHITAWENTLLKRYNDGLAGRKVEMPKEPFSVINRRIFEQNVSRSLEDVLADFRKTYQQTLTTVESIPEEDMFAHSRFAWTGERTLFDYIWGNTAGHYTEHLAAITRMKK